MVELVIVLPIFLLVLFGIVELSRAWYTLQLTTAAAREAVRAAAVANLPESNVSAVGVGRIDAVLATGGVESSCGSSAASCTVSRTVSLNTPPAGIDVGASPEFADASEVVANVRVRFRTLFPLLIPRLQEIEMEQSAAMRHEGV